MKVDKNYYTFGHMEQDFSYSRTKRTLDFEVSEETGIECQLADSYGINFNN